LTPEKTLDVAAYQNYSPLFLGTFFSLTYGVSFGALSSVIVHTAIFHGSEIWQRAKLARNQDADVHLKMMRKYPDTPDLEKKANFEHALLEEDSPYFEVRASVRNYDEDVPANTIRVSLWLCYCIAYLTLTDDIVISGMGYRHGCNHCCVSREPALLIAQPVDQHICLRGPTARISAGSVLCQGKSLSPSSSLFLYLRARPRSASLTR